MKTVREIIRRVQHKQYVHRTQYNGMSVNVPGPINKYDPKWPLLYCEYYKHDIYGLPGLQIMPNPLPIKTLLKEAI